MESELNGFVRLYLGFLNCFVDFLDAQTGDAHFLTTTRKIKVKVSGCVYSLKGINQNHQEAHIHVHTW